MTDDWSLKGREIIITSGFQEIFHAFEGERLYHSIDIETLRRKILQDIAEAFDEAEIDDTIWYDNATTLYEEIEYRINKIFGMEE